MNERIKELMKQAGTDSSGKWMGVEHAEKFAELIVRECANFSDKGTRGGIGELMKKHFGVEEFRTQPDQEAAAFIAAENKKVASRYGYVPKLHPSEWKE